MWVQHYSTFYAGIPKFDDTDATVQSMKDSGIFLGGTVEQLKTNGVIFTIGFAAITSHSSGITRIAPRSSCSKSWARSRPRSTGLDAVASDEH